MLFVRPKNLDEKALILDIRPQEEYLEERLFLPHIHEVFDENTNIEKIIEKYNLNNNKTINILCSSGSRAETMAAKLQENGIYNVAIVLGGMDGVKYDDLPTITQ